MVEQRSASPPELNFCTQCGARLPRDARFCASCGRAITSLVVDDTVPRATAATQSPRGPAAARRATVPVDAVPRGWRDQVLGLTVLALFLAVGLGLWVTTLRPGVRTSSAPSRQAPPQDAGGMPAGHPPTTLPDEAKKFVASMVEKAQAAPNDVATWKNLAQLQSRAGEIDPSYTAAAVESYKHVLGLAPDDDDAIRGLANVYYDQQQFPPAAEQYEHYLKLHPDDPSVRTDLATTYLYQRQFDRAVGAYQQVIKAHPDFLQAHFNLGLAYEAMGKRDLALASLATARRLATDEPTQNQIDKVTAQLKGEAASGPRGGPFADGGSMPPGATAGGGAAPGGAPGSGAAPSTGAPAAGTASAAMAKATDFHGAVEAGLRAHAIIGPKITAIAWPAPAQARVSLADFPIQSMPDFARNLFRARLETILDDAKTRFPTSGETGIDLVDTSSGAVLEHVTH